MSPRAGRSTNGGPGATMAETTERTISPAGRVLRRWRSHRRLSQMDLALRAGISARHLSFVETGRSAASREVLLSLAAVLRMPLRARNELLEAAGYARIYGHTDPARLLEPEAGNGPDAELSPVRRAIDFILAPEEPYSAMVIDRAWNVLAARARRRRPGSCPPRAAAGSSAAAPEGHRRCAGASP